MSINLSNKIWRIFKMSDQNKSEKPTVLSGIFVNVMALIIAGGISFIAYSVWTQGFGLAEVKIISSQISDLKENTNTQISDLKDNMNMRFDAVDERFKTEANNTNTRFNDFTKSISMLLEIESKNADERFTDFKENNNLRLTEIIESVKTLEESVKPSYKVVAEELNGIISQLIKLHDTQLNREEFNEILAQVEIDLENMSQKVESLLRDE